MSNRANSLKALFLGAAMTAGISLPAAIAPAHADSFSNQQRSEIEQMIRDYLLEHPEIVIEAAMKHRAAQEEAERVQQAGALKGAAAFFANAKDFPRTGNAEGDVQMVEFFDYQCGYCKKVFPQVMDIMEEDGKLDVVMVEFPVLGPVSEYAAKAALAARNQGKYMEYHVALMGYRGRLSEKVILETAEEVGLDADQLQKDMASDEISSHIARNQELASALGIRGTPAFLIGSELAPGAIDKAAMEEMIANARKGS
ncbi:DsbA family protein [Aestuariispira insulae]|uniref:Protein-disulfide isomerase n=1 Tax=Aestuariispira insulae TaxID=1461337 RepID=A0A3D9HR65_9PROT|nr:DsbA family protein [Aestuariispira insulae]RED51993.1 protein-disulfide isomerase [Aestuariispira insulae]